MTEFSNEVECDACNGVGWTVELLCLGGPRTGLHEVTCEYCNGHGLREMTDDEAEENGQFGAGA